MRPGFCQISNLIEESVELFVNSSPLQRRRF